MQIQKTSSLKPVKIQRRIQRSNNNHLNELASTLLEDEEPRRFKSTDLKPDYS
jgi:hypothetical protein